MNTRRNRNSILQSAGDALGLRLNKRKRLSTIPSGAEGFGFHRPGNQSIYDDVILEISAENSGAGMGTLAGYTADDSAERERLRDAAAQAVGLPHKSTASPYLTPQAQTNGTHHHDDMEHDTSTGHNGSRGKLRGGMTKTSGNVMPHYPATLSSLQSHVQTSSSVVKLCPATGAFLLLSRSKQWKTRYLVLTTLQGPRNPHPESHLHVFKSGAGDERELERLRINSNSIVYVADEEFGQGRQFVLKVGGRMVEVGDKALVPHTWMLQMPDSANMQRWIQYVKNAMLLQKPEREGLVDEIQALAKDRGETTLPTKTRRQSTQPPVQPITQTVDSTADSSTQASANSAGGGPVAALKGLWNNRPTSRQMSISGSSVVTAFAPSSMNSQTSALATAQTSQSNSQLNPAPQDGESTQTESHQSKSRESVLYSMFNRPTSPPINTNVGPAPGNSTQPSAGTSSYLSPPLSPTSSVPLSVDETVISSPSTTVPSRFSPTGSTRHAHHSSSFSVDWDAIDGATLAGLNSKRNTNPPMPQGLAPPPRRRPITGGGVNPRQPSPPKELAMETESKHSQSAIATDMSLTQKRKLMQEAHEAREQREVQNTEKRLTYVEGPEISLENALAGFGGQEQSYFEDEDDIAQEIVAADRGAPLDLSPRSVHSQPHSRGHGAGFDEDGEDSQYLPSPQHRPNLLPLSSASSFGANASARTPTYDRNSMQGLGQFSHASTISLHSDSPRDDGLTEEGNEHMDSFGEQGEAVNQFHLPTGSRRRSLLGSVPRQLSPPAGPPPPVPMFHSPIFSASVPPLPHNHSNEYSGSDRPTSSSSIPSTVPSLPGLPPLISKRMSTMSSSDAPSIRSNDSSGSIANSAKHAAHRLSAAPGPLGPRSAGPSHLHAHGLPPPRPLPTATTLPPAPAPLDDLTSVGGHHRFSLSSKMGSLGRSGSGSAAARSDFVNRPGRFSVGPAGPPPTAALPPTPLGHVDSGMDIFGGGFAPRQSFSSTDHSSGHQISSSLFSIPASPNGSKPLQESASNLPAMAPLPIRPLPPTPDLIGDENRPVSPSLSAISNRSSRSTSALPFGKMSSLKARLRMMSNPTPSTSNPAAAARQSMSAIPPAQPPPSFPPPEVPYQSYVENQWGVVDLSVPSQRSSSPPVPMTPLGETITSRLEHLSQGNGALSLTTGSNGGSFLPGSGTSTPSPAATLSFISPRAIRPMQPPGTLFQTETMPLSPPPRRNSRTSKDLTHADDRWKAAIAGLAEDGVAERRADSPYEAFAPPQLSAINLPSTIG